MKERFQFSVAIAAVMLFVSLTLLYQVKGFREAALTVLLEKEFAHSAAPKFGTRSLAALPGAVSDVAPASAASSTSVSSAPGVGTSSVKAFEYKLVQDPDPCLFNKLGAQGWQLLQLSNGDLETVFGSDELCKSSGFFAVIPWVLLGREKGQ